MLINKMTEEIVFRFLKLFLLQRGLLNHALFKRSREEKVEKMRGKKRKEIKEGGKRLNVGHI